MGGSFKEKTQDLLTGGVSNAIRDKKEGDAAKDAQERADEIAKADADRISSEKIELAKQEASKAIADAVARRGIEAGEVGEFGLEDDEDVEKKKTVLGKG